MLKVSVLSGATNIFGPHAFRLEFGVLPSRADGRYNALCCCCCSSVVGPVCWSLLLASLAAVPVMLWALLGAADMVLAVQEYVPWWVPPRTRKFLGTLSPHCAGPPPMFAACAASPMSALPVAWRVVPLVCCPLPSLLLLAACRRCGTDGQRPAGLRWSEPGNSSPWPSSPVLGRAVSQLNSTQLKIVQRTFKRAFKGLAKAV